MHRLTVLYPPPADPDHFRTYYEETHLKLVAKLPGLRGYRYGFAEGQATSADLPNYATGGAVVLNYELRAG